MIGDGPLARLRRMRGAIFPGWRVAGGAAVMQLLVAALFFQSFGTYATFWMAEFGWSKTTISLAFSLHRTESGLLGPLHGWLLQRFPTRAVIRAGVLLLAGGLALLALVQSLPLFFVAILVMALGSSLCGMLSLMTVLVNWFVRRRAGALAAMQIGMSVGGLGVPLVAWALLTFGWRPVALASALIVLAAGLPIAGLMHRRPEDVGLEPDGGAPPRPAARGAPPAAEFGTRAALATRAFWLMSWGHAAAVAVVSALLVHYVLFLVDERGLGLAVAASLFALLTGFSIGGQLFGGAIGDVVDKRLLATSGMLGHAAGVAVLALVPGMLGVVVGTALHGLAWGLRGPLMGALRADYFGSGAFATIMGFSSMIVMAGSVGGPLLAGVVADRTGSYVPAFLVLAGVALAGAVAFAALRPPRKRGSE